MVQQLAAREIREFLDELRRDLVRVPPGRARDELFPTLRLVVGQLVNCAKEKHLKREAEARRADNATARPITAPQRRIARRPAEVGPGSAEARVVDLTNARRRSE